MFEELHIALDQFWKRDITPSPKGWGRGTSDASDGGFVTFVLNDNLLPLQVRERVHAGSALTMASQQRAPVFSFRGLRGLKGFADAFGYAWNIGLAERSYRDLFMRAVNRDCFQGRVFGQSLHHRTRQAGVPVSFWTVFTFRIRSHIYKGQDNSARGWFPILPS